MFEPFGREIDWSGHYDKPVGREPVFHVNRYGEIRICRNSEWDRFLFPAVMDADAIALARAVNYCKARYSHNGSPGGSFCINEYGIVIVPISTGGYGYVLPKAVGRWRGELWFKSDGGIFSMNTDFSPGAMWPYPYIGMKYHLAENGYIYYRLNDDDEKTCLRAPTGNDELIFYLHLIRGYEAISFLVNNHGIVLTKVNDVPVYVGRIDMRTWYPDPLCTIDFDGDMISRMITQLNKCDRRAWKDRFEYERILAAYWKGGRRLSSVAMRQKLLTIFRNHTGGSGR